MLMSLIFISIPPTLYVCLHGKKVFELNLSLNSKYISFGFCVFLKFVNFYSKSYNINLFYIKVNLNMLTKYSISIFVFFSLFVISFNLFSSDSASCFGIKVLPNMNLCNKA